MKSVKLKQFGLAFCLLVSLFVSSVSACTCSHHPEKVETEVSSCHQHSENGQTEQHHDADSNEKAQSLVSQDECCCIEPAPKVVAKVENIKIEKQKLAAFSPLPVETAFVPQTISVKSEFSRKFYSTDSFYNLTPGRAPPAL
jgi:hypothetical protein